MDCRRQYRRASLAAAASSGGNPDNRLDERRKNLVPIFAPEQAAPAVKEPPFLAAVLAREVIRRVEWHEDSCALKAVHELRGPVGASFDLWLVEELYRLIRIEWFLATQLRYQIPDELMNVLVVVRARIAQKENVRAHLCSTPRPARDGLPDSGPRVSAQSGFYSHVTSPSGPSLGPREVPHQHLLSALAVMLPKRTPSVARRAADRPCGPAPSPAAPGLASLPDHRQGLRPRARSA